MNVDVVIAFDVDGTLECGEPPGIIKIETVKRLKEKGFIVGIVGAYKKVQRHISHLDFYLSGDPHKPENLKKVRETYKPAFCIYVADLPSDKVAALKNGFSYIKPEDFTVMEHY
ncbi:MAG: HAD family hydrolase [Euryarchaeota archaeon]|nr:HAD family hydrolase [Euryarchaeota archaeon]